MTKHRLFLPLAMLAAILAWSQSFTATLRGTITDATGAAIPGAKVTVTEADRNLPHVTVTDSLGRYSAPNLPPGAYELTVEAAGFRTFVQQRFQLLVQQQATIDIRMEVGEVLRPSMSKAPRRC